MHLVPAAVKDNGRAPRTSPKGLKNRQGGIYYPKVDLKETLLTLIFMFYSKYSNPTSAYNPG